MGHFLSEIAFIKTMKLRPMIEYCRNGISNLIKNPGQGMVFPTNVNDSLADADIFNLKKHFSAPWEEALNMANTVFMLSGSKGDHHSTKAAGAVDVDYLHRGIFVLIGTCL